MDEDDLTAVYWPADYLEADAIRQALTAKGISCHIDGENLASWGGAGPFGNAGRCRMRVLVRAADAERARAIIKSQDWPRFA